MQKDPSRKTGPNTPNGKVNSSKNSTKHGLCGNPDKLLPGETQEAYNAARDAWCAEYDSASPGTVPLLESLINCDRLMRYSIKAVIDAEIALHEAETAANPDTARLEELNGNLTNKLRYKTQHERSFQRALRNIEQFGSRRVREAQAAERLDTFQNKVAFDMVMLCQKNDIDPVAILPLLKAATNPDSETDQPNPTASSSPIEPQP